MDRSDELTLACAAAHLASEAITELLRFQREGHVCNLPHGDCHPASLLAEALHKAITLEDAYLAQQPCYFAERSAAGQLAAACRKYLIDLGVGDPELADPEPDDAPEITEEDLPFR